MTCTAYAAVAANGVIGRDNALPWRLPGDLPRFKELTLGKTLLMGRRTFDSIGRPLPGRRTVVLTRQPGWVHPGVEVLHSYEEAKRLITAPGADVVLAGGGEVYRELLPVADRLEITEVHRDVDGDTYFPAIDPADWVETAREERDGFAFVSYQRRRGTAG